jgi:hypothetical protein
MIGPYGLNTFLNDVDVTPIGICFTYTLLSSFADRSNFFFGAFVAVSPSDATFAPGFLRGLRVAFAAGASLSTASPSVVAAAIDIGGTTISTSLVPSPAIAPSFALSSPSSSPDDPLRNLTPRADGAIARAATADAPRVDVTDADVDARAIDVHAVRAARRNDILCERTRVELCGAQCAFGRVQCGTPITTAHHDAHSGVHGARARSVRSHQKWRVCARTCARGAHARARIGGKLGRLYHRYGWEDIW